MDLLQELHNLGYDFESALTLYQQYSKQCDMQGLVDFIESKKATPKISEITVKSEIL